MQVETSVTSDGTLNQKLADFVARVSNRDVKVGIPKGAGTYETGESVAAIATVHEFGATINHPGGTPYKPAPDGGVVFTEKDDPAAIGETQPHTITIPERSFLRVPLRASQDVWVKVFREGMKRVLAGDLSMEQLLDQVGAKAVGISQQAISSGIAPPNAPSTVRQKGSSTPLFDEGTLFRSITWVVEERVS